MYGRNRVVVYPLMVESQEKFHLRLKMPYGG